MSEYKPNDSAAFGFVVDGHTLYLRKDQVGGHMFDQLGCALYAAHIADYLDDDEHGSRIAISQLIKSDWMLARGHSFSIDLIVGTLGHKIPVVDLREGTVSLYENYDAIKEDNPIFVVGVPYFINKYTDYKIDARPRCTECGQVLTD